MVAVSEVRAFADRGLEGDRFFRESWSEAKRPDKAVTFIEEETLRAAAAELGWRGSATKPGATSLPAMFLFIELLDREFTIGSVVMRGLRLFEPCGHLEKVSKIPGIFDALEHRSGLKAEILTDGVIRVGDRWRCAKRSKGDPGGGVIPMEFGLHLPASSAAVQSADLIRFVQQAEALGFYCITVADHVIVPKNISIPYPYTVDGKYPGTGYHLETLTTMSFLAGADTTHPFHHQCHDRALSESRHHGQDAGESRCSFAGEGDRWVGCGLDEGRVRKSESSAVPRARPGHR